MKSEFETEEADGFMKFDITGLIINSQSLEDTQVGYISQKYTLDKYTLEKYT